MAYSLGKWCGGLADWVEGDTAYLSVAFTWMLKDAYQRAVFYRAQGYKVRAGGPGVFTQMKYLSEVAETGGDYPDAITKQNPMATIASRGCPVGCWFCIVPAMEGKAFTELPDFPVRPVLCDNNLSALSPEYQDHIVRRYRAAEVPLLDANSGFEPRTFDEEVYRRWMPINKGPWRFAYDDEGDGPHVERVMKMLGDVPQRRKRVYVLIGNEPFDVCMGRIQRVIDWGGDPHCQPLMKLNALDKKPWVRHDWTARLLVDVARWANRHLWKYTDFEGYRASDRTAPSSVDPNQTDLWGA
jgi:hypothetical protein